MHLADFILYTLYTGKKVYYLPLNYIHTLKVYISSLKLHFCTLSVLASVTDSSLRVYTFMGHFGMK